jgi:hypothetical protein
MPLLQYTKKNKKKPPNLTRYILCIFLSNTMYHLYSKCILVVRIIIIISISEGRYPHLNFSQLDLRRTEKHPNINVVPPRWHNYQNTRKTKSKAERFARTVVIDKIQTSRAPTLYNKPNINIIKHLCCHLCGTFCVQVCFSQQNAKSRSKVQCNSRTTVVF